MSNYKTPSALAYLFPYYLAPLLLVVDLGLRSRVIARFSGQEWLLYLASFLFLNEALFIVASWKMSRSRCWRLARLGKSVFILVLLLLSAIAYTAFKYFGMIPNTGMLDYVGKEPASLWSMVSGSIGMKHLFLTAGLVAVSWIIPMIRTPFQTACVPAAARYTLMLFSLGVLFWTARDFDQCTIPITQMIIDGSLAAASRLATSETTAEAEPTVLEDEQLRIESQNTDSNILLIINESVRRTGLSIYNDSLETTPALAAFRDRHPGEFYQFRWGRTNSTMTWLSVPSILNGISPVAETGQWRRAPFLWDYARAAGYHTLLVSGSCYRWGNWEQHLLRPPGPDFVYTECQHITSSNRVDSQSLPHQMGIPDDRIFIDRVISHLDSLRGSNKNFCGVLHLYGPHYPYWHLVTDRLVKDASMFGNYLNSIYQQDKALSRLWAYLENNRLLERTVIMHTSDHGEAFGERGYYGHLLNFFEEDIGIPIWIYIPAAIQLSLGRNRITALSGNLDKNVSNLDILPTLLEIMASDSEHPALARLDGNSLFTEIDNTRKILITNYNKLQFRTMNQSYALVSDSLKYIYSLSNKRLHSSCYNSIRDPGEKNDLIKCHSVRPIPVAWDLLIDGEGLADSAGE